jgi:dephospho-CoA kinase
MRKQKQNKKQIIVGLTGSFGSGKTTVARIFESLGAYVIDADELAHNCIRPQTSAYRRIIHTFGEGILKKNKIIDRRKLASIVFNNRDFLHRLNNIIHPQVIRIIKNKIKSSRSRVIVLDAPLLLEAGLKKIVDKLIVVKINRKKQVERIRNRTSLDKSDILKRIKSQISQNVKSRFANFVIDNNGTMQETRRQVEKIRRVLWKS